MRINTFYNYQVSLQWVHYAAVMDRVAAQFGIGPVLEVSRSHSRNTEQFGLPGFNESEFRSDETLYGLDLSLGVDWFFTRRLSLGGRASLQAMMGTRHEMNMFRTSSSRNTNQIEQDRVDVRSGGGNIYLTGISRNVGPRGALSFAARPSCRWIRQLLVVRRRSVDRGHWTVGGK